MKKGQKPSRHVRKVRTKRGRRKVVVNRRVRKKSRSYRDSPVMKDPFGRKIEGSYFIIGGKALTPEQAAIEQKLDLFRSGGPRKIIAGDVVYERTKTPDKFVKVEKVVTGRGQVEELRTPFYRPSTGKVVGSKRGRKAGL